MAKKPPIAALYGLIYFDVPTIQQTQPVRRFFDDEDDVPPATLPQIAEEAIERRLNLPHGAMSSLRVLKRQAKATLDVINGSAGSPEQPMMIDMPCSSVLGSHSTQTNTAHAHAHANSRPVLRPVRSRAIFTERLKRRETLLCPVYVCVKGPQPQPRPQSQRQPQSQSQARPVATNSDVATKPRQCRLISSIEDVPSLASSCLDAITLVLSPCDSVDTLRRSVSAVFRLAEAELLLSWRPFAAAEDTPNQPLTCAEPCTTQIRHAFRLDPESSEPHVIAVQVISSSRPQLNDSSANSDSEVQGIIPPPAVLDQGQSPRQPAVYTRRKNRHVRGASSLHPAHRQPSANVQLRTNATDVTLSSAARQHCDTDDDDDFSLTPPRSKRRKRTPRKAPAHDSSSDDQGAESEANSDILNTPALECDTAGATDVAATSPLLLSHNTNSWLTSASPPHQSIMAPRSRRKPGECGLRNLGNTCYMASGIQCLAHIAPIRDFFLSTHFRLVKADSDAALPHGQLCVEMAKLLHRMWGDTSYTCESLLDLKRVVAVINPIFEGFGQQDAQEFLSFMLDALSEDAQRSLSRKLVRHASSSDSSSEDDEEEAAAQPSQPSQALSAQSTPSKGLAAADKAWRQHLQRNEGFLSKFCHGQFVSDVKCLACSKRSFAYDPFAVLSLPVPVRVRVTLRPSIFQDDQQDAQVFSFVAPAPPHLELQHVRHQLATRLSCSESQLAGHWVEPGSGRPTSSPSSGQEAPTALFFKLCSDDVVQIDAAASSAEAHATWHPLFAEVVCQSPHGRGAPSTSLVLAGLWSQAVQPVTAVRRRLYTVLGQMDIVSSSAAIAERVLEDHKLRVVVTNVERDGVPDLDDLDIADCVHEAGMDCQQVVDLESTPVLHAVIEVDPFASDGDSAVCAPASEPESTQSSNSDDPLSLVDCMRCFFVEEHLSVADAWKCDRCRDVRAARKRMRVTRMPDLLVVHLKRFRTDVSVTTGSVHREKVDAFVSFPFELELEGIVPVVGEAGGKKNLSYSLVASINHFGDVDFGHYTAYASCDGTSWLEFDDSRVRGISRDDVVDKNAYCLFYLRNGSTPGTSDPTLENDAEVVDTRAEPSSADRRYGTRKADGQSSGSPGPADHEVMSASASATVVANGQSGFRPASSLETDSTTGNINPSVIEIASSPEES